MHVKGESTGSYKLYVLYTYAGMILWVKTLDLPKGSRLEYHKSYLWVMLEKVSTVKMFLFHNRKTLKSFQLCRGPFSYSKKENK